MKTAVEWYSEQMQLKEQFTQDEFNNIFNQAKEMEKQQMNNDTKIYSKADILNALHSLELEDNKNYSSIYDGIKKWYYSNIQ